MKILKLRVNFILPLLNGLLLIVFPFLWQRMCYLECWSRQEQQIMCMSPPTRYQVAGHLFDANFTAYQKDALDMLLADIEMYGVSILDTLQQ